jgi:hypothetical protein
MSQHEITVEGGTSKLLLTAGKYCDRNILVTARPSESGGEDISAELAEQKTLISDIKTALANKAAGNIETCTMEFNGDGGMYTGILFFTTVEYGSVTTHSEADFSTPITFTVVKNSYVYFGNGVPMNSGNVADVDRYIGSQLSGHCKITGDTVFYN